MVQRWDIVTIGHLSRNLYYGEANDRAYRQPLCTCTLLRSDAGSLLVDPSCSDPRQMAEELNRRTGLRPDQVDAVFLTHAHGDHHFGLAHFPQARWLAAAAVAEELNASGRYDRSVEPAEGRLPAGVEMIATPGHTLNHHSLRFDCEGWSVVVAADAAMTRDFFRDRRGYFNSADHDLAARTIDQLGRIADVIVPGHDNWFLTPRARARRPDPGPEELSA